MSERNSKGKYQEEPFNQNLKDAQRSWDESFSKTPSKNSSDDFSYSGITPPQDAFPGVSPDPPQKPEVTNAPPETQTRSTETPIIKPDSGYEPDRSRYQIESNQLEMDAQRDWEEKMAGSRSARDRDSAPGVFSDPADDYNPFSGKGESREEPTDDYSSHIRSTDNGAANPSINVRSSSDGVHSSDSGSSSSSGAAGGAGSAGGAANASGTAGGTNGGTGGGGGSGTTGATIIFTAPGKNGPNIGHVAIKSLERGGKRVVSSAIPTSQMRQTHTGYGTTVVYNTVGRYVMIPGVRAVYNRASGVTTTMVSRVMLHQRKKNDFFTTLYGDTDFQNAIAKALRQKMGRDYINIQSYNSIASRLKRKGYGTDIKKLKELVKNGSVSGPDKTLIETYINMSSKKKKLDKLVNPTGANNINSYYVIIKKSLRERGIEPNAKKLKKGLKKSSLSGVDKQLAEAFLGINRIRKLSEYNRFSLKSGAKSLKRGGVRLVRDFKRQVKRMMRNSENYTAEGLIFTYTMARRSLKVAHAVIKGPVKTTGTVVTRSVRQASQMTRAGTMMAKASGKAVNPVIKQTYKRQFKGAIKGGTRLTRRVVGSVDRLSAKIVQKGTVRAAKMSSKLAANTVKLSTKVLGKAMVGATKALMFVVNLIISLITTILAAGFPVIIIIVVIGVLVGGLLAIFSFNGGEMEDGTDSDTVVLVGQQYVDALDKCHEKFKSYLDQLSSDSSYETVTINYRDEKNTKVYEDWKNETGMVEGDNNIKECLCLMAVLFDFNMEEYVPKPLTDEIKYADREKLYDFMEIYDIDKSEYDGTYQNLIRSYLVGLFNGSHDVEKSVSVTYCGGCTSRKNSEGEDEYYCPGHRHLDVTVTTYYFDKLFNCVLKATCGLDPLSSTLVGSNNIEKVWFGLINAGYTEEAAAGVIGNLMWESGGGPTDIALNTTEDNGKGEGIGMCQWSYDRKTAFINYCNQQGSSWPNEDVSLQFNFMLSEMQGGDWLYVGHDYGYSKNTKMSVEEFKKVTDVEYATYIFCANFERCDSTLAHMDKRVEYAQSVYANYHGRTQEAGGNVEILQPGQKTVSLGVFKLTYYDGCDRPECNGIGNRDAQGRPIGSLGRPLQVNHSIAVDPSVIPYGSKVLIDGIVYTAEDCGGAVKGNHIDIYVGDDADAHARCERLGVKNTEVYLVK